METSNRLVSLWDMISFNAQAIVELVWRMTSENMTIIFSQQFGQDYNISEDQFLSIKRDTEQILDQSKMMSMAITVLKSQRLLEALTQINAIKVATHTIEQTTLKVIPIDKMTSQLLARRMTDLGETIRDEMMSRAYISLDSRELELYQPKAPHFGHEVRAKFPTTIYEIDEAAKCLAFGRSTACVFHLMRALETVLKAVHLCLSATPPRDRNWSSYLTPIREERNKRGTKWAENDFFQDVWQRLDSIKDSQRNQTMHVDAVYTEEEARHIFETTRLFMAKIASRMNEQGLPPA